MRYVIDVPWRTSVTPPPDFDAKELKGAQNLAIVGVALLGEILREIERTCPTEFYREALAAVAAVMTRLGDVSTRVNQRDPNLGPPTLSFEETFRAWRRWMPSPEPPPLVGPMLGIERFEGVAEIIDQLERSAPELLGDREPLDDDLMALRNVIREWPWDGPFE
jgi:hypothetical protein